jgi:hypothetical protein
MLGRTHATSGCAAVQKSRSGGRALKQESVPHLGSGDVSVVYQWCGKRMLTKLRVHHGLLVANMVEYHHEGVLHAACGRWRAPGVMTTTLRANAQELQVSTTKHYGRGLEENARDAPAWSSRAGSSPDPANNRYRAGEASIRSPEEQDRSHHHSAHRGGLGLSTGTGLYGACRSTQCCLWLCGLYGWSPVRA